MTVAQWSHQQCTCSYSWTKLEFARRAMALRRLGSPFVHIFRRNGEYFETFAFSSTATRLDRFFSSDSAIVSDKIEVNGVNIHYERTGGGSHAVFLMPGVLGSTRTDFGPQLKKLNKEKFTVICWDPRGYGKSIPPERTWPPDFFQRDADDAVRLLGKLGLSQVSLVGWSDGGRTAMIMAGQHPNLIRKLVVWGASADVVESDVKFLNSIRNPDLWHAEVRQPFIDIYGETYFRKHWEAWYQAYSSYIERDGFCKNELPKICCPTLILHGQHDHLITQGHAEYLNKNIKNSRLIIWPEATHHLHLRFVSDFNHTVEEFLLEN